MLYRTNVTFPVLRKLYAASVAENDPEMAAWVHHLKALYEHEVHTTIESELTQGSRSLNFWREYFKLKPSRYSRAVRKRLTYARQTKVEMPMAYKLLRLRETIE